MKLRGKKGAVVDVDPIIRILGLPILWWKKYMRMADT